MVNKYQRWLARCNTIPMLYEYLYGGRMISLHIWCYISVFYIRTLLPISLSLNLLSLKLGSVTRFRESRVDRLALLGIPLLMHFSSRATRPTIPLNFERPRPSHTRLRFDTFLDISCTQLDEWREPLSSWQLISISNHTPTLNLHHESPLNVCTCEKPRKRFIVYERTSHSSNIFKRRSLEIVCNP